MKFSAMTLACLASLAATTYSYADANVLGKRDDNTFKDALKIATADLGAIGQTVYDYDADDYYKISEAANTAFVHLRSAREAIGASAALSEAGVADIRWLFQDLLCASKSLYNEFVAKKPTLEADGVCRPSYKTMEHLHLYSEYLVYSIADNSHPKVKGPILVYAKEYLNNIGLTAMQFDGSVCGGRNSRRPL